VTAVTPIRTTRTGGRAASTRHIPPTLALAVGKPTADAPEDWEWLPLSDLAQLESGHTPSRRHPEYWGGDVPWISITDAKRCHGSVIHDTAESTNALGIANSSARLIPAGAVCLSRTASVGYVVITGRPMATSQDFVNWVCGDRLVPEFLQYLLLAEGNDLLRFSSGAVHKTIYFPEVKAFHVCVPSVAEQHRIVAILDEAFEAIGTAKANTERNLRNANEIFDSYLATVFSARHVGWSDRQLQELCQRITVGHVGSMATRYTADGIPFLRSQNIRPFSVSTENLVFIDEEFHFTLNKSSLQAGDVAIVRTGYPGTAAVIPRSLGPANCSDLVIVRPGPDIDANFLCAFFNSAFGKSMVNGKVVGAAQKHFNVGAAKEVMLHLPPLAEQKAIVARADELRERINRLEGLEACKLAALDELKRSLLHQAFTGQLTSKSTDRQLAEAA